MVAAVHPAHAVETASTLRYARQYSALQSSGGGHVSIMSSQVRDLTRKVDSLKHNFEKALQGDEYSIAWTRESLQGSVHCQPKSNCKQCFDMQSHISWSQAHASKAAVRGQRRDRSGVGYITKESIINPDSDPPEKECEVTFEGRHGRPNIVLWYPEMALEMVKPPPPLVDAMRKLDDAEQELTRMKNELATAQKEEK
ncbi:unnamed protein product, partial [Polarella glacialis]